MCPNCQVMEWITFVGVLVVLLAPLTGMAISCVALSPWWTTVLGISFASMKMLWEWRNLKPWKWQSRTRKLYPFSSCICKPKCYRHSSLITLVLLVLFLEVSLFLLSVNLDISHTLSKWWTSVSTVPGSFFIDSMWVKWEFMGTFKTD